LKHRKPKRRRWRNLDEGAYTCPTCGQTIVIPLDPSAGAKQSYTEDCPVCCHPNVVQVEFFDAVEPARVWAQAE
jgi:hypothetical protein